MVKTGAAFSEHIFHEGYRKRDWGGERKNNGRDLFLPLFLIVILLILILRVFFLQIIKGSYFRTLSDNNRTKTVLIYAPRGVILDRNNIPLVLIFPVLGKIKMVRQYLFQRIKH